MNGDLRCKPFERCGTNPLVVIPVEVHEPVSCLAW